MHQNQQTGTDQNFVSDWVQEGTECGGLIEFPSQIPIRPVGQRKHHKHHRRRRILCVGRQRGHKEHRNQQRDGDDSRPRH